MADIVEKWGERVAERGFAQIPNYLLLMNQFLDPEHKVPPVDLIILIELVGAWWKKEEMPFPSLNTLAARSGISSRQAQRSVTRLEEAGYIKRSQRKAGRLIASNAYDMSPLVERLNEIAIAFPNDAPRKILPKRKFVLKRKSTEGAG